MPGDDEAFIVVGQGKCHRAAALAARPLVEASSSAYKPIPTASLRFRGGRPRRAVRSHFGSISIFGGTPIVTFRVGAVRTASRRSPCGAPVSG